MANAERAPTKEDLLKLPRLARVAFSARCAQRVQPVFQQWTKSKRLMTFRLRPLDTEAVDKAILLAVNSASQGLTDENSASIARAIRATYEDVAYAAMNAAYAYRSYRDDATYGRMADAAAAASDAARAAAYAAAAARDASEAAAAATHAAAAYTAAARSVRTHQLAAGARGPHTARDADAARANAHAAMWADYECLHLLTTSECWDDDSLVSPDRLGPLWPQGNPPGWSDSTR